MKQVEQNSIIEVCNHCGKDVSIGSGNFVNRIPDFNDMQTRTDNDLPFPIEDFVCEVCDNSTLD